MAEDLPSGSFVAAAHDAGARADIDRLDARLRSAEYLQQEIGITLWGDLQRRDNGVRGYVKSIQDDIKILLSRADKSDSDHRHYLDLKRRQTCFGLEEMDKHIAEHDKMSAAEIADAINASQKKDKWTDRSILIFIGLLSAAATLIAVFK